MFLEDFPHRPRVNSQVLRFHGYFKEDILYSPEEDHRIRPVVIYYYLEDDTMCVVEPAVPNSGIPQGKRIKRQRLPKAGGGIHFLWKDLNIAMDLEVYGVKYRIVQCDAFTQVLPQRVRMWLWMSGRLFQISFHSFSVYFNVGVLRE